LQAMLFPLQPLINLLKRSQQVDLRGQREPPFCTVRTMD
jgi:hypothetical protein